MLAHAIVVQVQFAAIVLLMLGTTRNSVRINGQHCELCGVRVAGMRRCQMLNYPADSVREPQEGYF